ncbi:MAG: DNA polymerase III subunit beta [Kiritimatiellae bacterium]|jgi:DNA polymerase-3 subunit beta|nr:DNA polymerase III subunit beta [Kiritimatiellia bacterium]
MKFTIQKTEFIKGLQLIQSVVVSHTTLPVLYNVLITAEKDKIKLFATDLSISMICSLQAAVPKTGAGSFNAKMLFNIIRELPHDNVEFYIEDKNRAMIQCGQSSYKLLGISADEFPALPPFQTAHSFTIDQPLLKDALQKTNYAASDDESRLILNGVFISIKEQKMMVVATDGRRLALIEKEVEIPADQKMDFVIPTKTINELIKALKEEGTVKISLTKNMVSFEMDACTIISKLIEGVYPNYRLVIPSQCDEKVTVEREPLIGTLRRTAIMSNEKNPSVKITIAKNQLQIVASNTEVGEASEQIPVKYSGKPVTMTFNPNYLMDPLKSLSSDDITIELTDELSPAVVKSNIPFIYVLMPLRIS